MRPFSVAGIQMNVSATGDNLVSMQESLTRLMTQFPWVQMVLFSELAVSGLKLRDAQPLPGPMESLFCELAKKHEIWLIPGSVFESTKDAVYNTSIVINPQGEVVGRYRKMFPFQPYEPGVSAGTEPFVFDVPDVGRFGVLICYDMWFPEVCRSLVAMGAEVILHPSLTETIDRGVELAICRATAATNQCFVLNVNGVGDGGNGQSIFIGPAGDVLHLGGYAAEEIPVEIDLDRVARSREVGLRCLGQPLKSFRDRQFDFQIYQAGTRSEYLDNLGPLTMPTKGTRAGLGAEQKDGGK